MNDLAPMDGDPRDAEIELRPPLNYEAEQALLAAILGNNSAYDRVSDFLRPEHFADSVHGRVYEACGKLIERGQVANAVTLKNLFEHDKALAEVGGAQYLAKLQSSYLTSVNAKDYGRIILELFVRREIIEICELGAENARLGADGLRDDAVSLVDELAAEIADLGEASAGEAPGRPFPVLMDNWIETMEAARKAGGISGVPTGLRDLDAKLGGLHKSDLIVLAGRPAMGKTSMAMNIALNAARLAKSVLVLSLEMSPDQLSGRILGSESGVSADAMRRGDVAEADIEKVMDCRRELHGLKLTIESPRHPTVQACRAKARALKRRAGLDLVVIDYLQLMSDPGRTDNRVQEISKITRDLKKMATDLDVPVLALSQLSRQVEQREDKRPQLSDLRDGGTIEQDADIVIFVYREYEYAKREKPHRRARESDEAYERAMNAWRTRMAESSGQGDAIIGKNRHGPIGEVRLSFDAARTKFSNWGAGPQAGPAEQEEIPF